ncbi:MAG: glycosyltransferase [Verrucomicrobia bacterium]|nr:glycosyltransferase [Verrucomicrobiota bacterium]
MKISVVTACLNRRDLVKDAVESALRQNYPQVEHWIIDGGSTDGTLSMLERYPHLRVLSEPDSGIYDAWNKGIARSTGDLIAFLNTDDLFEPGAFQSCVALLERNSDADLVSGGCQIFRDNEVEMHRYCDTRRYALSLRNVTLGLPIINGRFFRRSVFNRIGLFDAEYRLSSDRDFLIRAALADLRDIATPELYYRYRWHSGSLTMNSGNDSLLAAIQEGIKISKIYDTKVSQKDRGTLKAWRRELNAVAFMIHLLRRRPSSAFSLAKTNLQEDPSWAIDLTRCGTLAVARRLRTAWRSWSKSR